MSCKHVTYNVKKLFIFLLILRHSDSFLFLTYLYYFQLQFLSPVPICVTTARHYKNNLLFKAHTQTYTFVHTFPSFSSLKKNLFFKSRLNPRQVLLEQKVQHLFYHKFVMLTKILILNCLE